MNFLLRSTLLSCAFILCATLSWGQISADFYFELSNGPGNMEAPVQVAFVNASWGEELQYSWTLDGVAFSVAEESSRLFLKGGRYEVCLAIKSEQLTDRQCQYLEFFDPPALPVLAQSSKR